MRCQGFLKSVTLPLPLKCDHKGLIDVEWRLMCKRRIKKDGDRAVNTLEKNISRCPLRESNARPSPYEGDALPLS